VLGVPGYAAATWQPASQAPRATASFPVRITFIDGYPLSGKSVQNIKMIINFYHILSHSATNKKEIPRGISF
jgi:hypothetical protein